MKKGPIKCMSLKDLIKEHEEIVRILKSGRKSSINKLLKEQSEELKEYKEEYKRKLSK